MIGVKSVKTYFGTNAERTAIPLSGFFPGDVFVETDTKTTYQHNGMAWVKTAVDGTNYLPLTGGTLTGGLVINEDGGDNDTRIEGDTDPNLFFVDAGNNTVGIGTNTPDSNFKLHAISSNSVALFERSGSANAGANVFYNPDTTNGNSVSLNFASDSTGTGATALRVALQIRAVFNVHNHATMDTQFDFYNYIAGSFAKRAAIGNGLVVGNPTGGDKGFGTINASAVYDDNTLLTDYVFEDDYKLLSIEGMKDFYTKNKHLPTIPGREKWEKDGKFSLGKLVNYLWETVEVQAIYISQLYDRVKALEND